MRKKFFYLILVLFPIIFFSFHNLNQTERNLSSFKKGNKQVPYNRNTENYTPIVDSHVHFMPFGGDAIPFNEVINYFKKSKVYFVNVYGIGQRVPIDSDCTYYLDCPGVSFTNNKK